MARAKQCCNRAPTMPSNLRSIILPPELTDSVLRNLVGFDLAQYACAAKSISTMTMKAKAMFAARLALTSKAARLSDAQLRDARGDAHVTLTSHAFVWMSALSNCTILSTMNIDNAHVSTSCGSKLNCHG